MQPKQRIILYAYHYMSEAILLFFVTLPIMYLNYNWIPYWGYIGIAILTCIVFSVYTYVTRSYMWYIFTAPLIGICFYLVGFPLFLTVLFASVLTWRYMNIRNEDDVKRENMYLKLTLFLSIGLMLFIPDIEIIIFVFIQFLILIFGYISGHLSVIQKSDRTQMNYSLGLFIAAMFLVGAVSLLYTFDIARFVLTKVWQGITYILGIVTTFIANILESIVITFEPMEQDSSQSIIEQGERIFESRETGDTPLIEVIIPYIIWGIILVIAAVVLYLIARQWKRKFAVTPGQVQDNHVSYEQLDQVKKEKDHFLKRIFRNYKQRPTHPVRKMVYQLEHRLADSPFARKPSETVEEWVKRIGIDSELDVYQKVRYGELEVKDEEVRQLQEVMSKIKTTLKDS
ncbi:DUF4129 domain-containing protein [Oceanobacillus halotolerans]|uniref:DUF4129 domain-containing protein n=1 Tax=Oceanobacillus halotolerans TaxID=2663380 RepID=UPI0013DB1365|nr:DUF4129 domain-containing protein [Oceanobacillus halotolerans]